MDFETIQYGNASNTREEFAMDNHQNNQRRENQNGLVTIETLAENLKNLDANVKKTLLQFNRRMQKMETSLRRRNAIL